MRAEQLERYVDAFMGALRDGLDGPSSGDCYHCVGSAESFGPDLDRAHLREHVRRFDFVPWLVLNAVVEEGNQDPRKLLGVRLGIDRIGGPEMEQEYVRRALTSYLRRRLLA